MGDMLETLTHNMGEMLDKLTDTDVQPIANLYDTNNYSNFRPQQPKQLTITSNRTFTNNKNNKTNNNDSLMKCIMKNIVKMLDLLNEEIEDLDESRTLTYDEFHDRMEIVIDQYNDFTDIYNELSVDDSDIKQQFDEIMDKLDVYDGNTQPKTAEPTEPEPFVFSIKSRSRRPPTPEQLARIEKEQREEARLAYDEKNRVVNAESRLRQLKSIKQMNAFRKKKIRNLNQNLNRTINYFSTDDA